MSSSPHRSAVYDPLELWARIDSRACERAASCPIVLLDLNFQHHDWWRAFATRNSEIDSIKSQRAHFAPERAEPLLREILMEAWSMGRSMPHAASLIFGMSPPVTAAIAGLSAPDIDRVVIERLGELRPRWENNRIFWRSLLQAAVGTDDDALGAMVLYSLQLLG